MSGSTTTSGVVIPPGSSPPFYQVTDDDHTAWIIITTALCLCWVLLFAGIRVLIRYTITPGFGLDDATVAISTILAVIQSSVLLRACSDGLGKSVELTSPLMLVQVQKTYYASNILFALSLGLSKISVVLFLVRLTASPQQKIIFHLVAGLIAAWTVASVSATSFQCELSHPWIIVGQKCPGAYLRLKILGSFDIVSELTIVSLTLYLVWGLYAKMYKKAIVVSVFAFRLGIIVMIVFRIINFDNPDRIPNPTLFEAGFIIWTQAELCYSLIAATIPTLRPFVTNLNTQFGALGAAEGRDDYEYGDGSDQNSHQLSKLRSGTKSADPSSAKRSFTRDPNFATTHAAASTLDGKSDLYSYGVWTEAATEDESKKRGGKRIFSGLVEEKPKGDATSVKSNESKRLVIRKDVTYEVHGE